MSGSFASAYASSLVRVVPGNCRAFVSIRSLTTASETPAFLSKNVAVSRREWKVISQRTRWASRPLPEVSISAGRQRETHRDERIVKLRTERRHISDCRSRS